MMTLVTRWPTSALTFVLHAPISIGLLSPFFCWVNRNRWISPMVNRMFNPKIPNFLSWKPIDEKVTRPSQTPLKVRWKRKVNNSSMLDSCLKKFHSIHFDIAKKYRCFHLQFVKCTLIPDSLDRHVRDNMRNGHDRNLCDCRASLKGSQKGDGNVSRFSETLPMA